MADPHKNPEDTTNNVDQAASTSETTPQESDTSTETSDETTEQPAASRAVPHTDGTAGEPESADVAGDTPDTVPTQPTQSERSTTEVESEPRSAANGIILLAVVLVLIAAALFGGMYYFGAGTTNDLSLDEATSGGADGTSTVSAAEAFDLPEPGTAVARVNGTEVEAREFNQQLTQSANQAQQQGMDLSSAQARASLEQQTLDTLINTELLLQAASEEGISASEEEVAAELERIRGGFESEEQFEGQLAAAETDIETLEANIDKDLTLQAYLDENAAPESFDVTDEEVQAFYEQVASGNANVPPLEEVRPQVEQQLRLQKQQEAVQGILEELRADAEIENLLTSPAGE